MPAPLSAGDVIPASAETSYTPSLIASTTNPTLGSGSVQQGRYYVDPITGWVHGQARITFGTSGTNAGSGNYRITLPTAIDNMSTGNTLGNSDIIGWGIIRDNGTLTQSRIVTLHMNTNSGGSGGVGTAELFIGDGATNVNEASPFAWAASDSIAVQFAYPGA